jgi:glycosyltransferase involved in cell wall biosynthesis
MGRLMVGTLKRAIRWGLLEAEAQAARRTNGGELAIFHEFAPPPSGGGNQFLFALSLEIERSQIRIERNRISARTQACLFNSFNYDSRRLERFARTDVRMVHRVDGPVGIYRGFDDGTDQLVAMMNQLADATIFQSRYSLEKHRELGFELVDPCVIPNAVDPAIFHAEGREPFSRDRPVRVIATSWSDNPRKGGPTYRWLTEQLDPDRYELTFVGRSREALPRMIAPVPSVELARLLRSSDVFVTASEHEACPNHVLEALACGLPVVYHSSGGTPELVGDAGLGFRDREEIPELLDRVVREYEERQAAIVQPRLADVARRYLEVLQLDAPV